MNENDKYLIGKLFEKQIDGSLTQEEADQLEKLTLSDKDAQDFYFDLSVQNAGLEDYDLDLASEETHTKKDSAIILKLAVAASLIIGLLLGQTFNTKPAKTIATLTSVEHCKWSEGTLATAKNSPLSAGSMRLEEGLAKLKFINGVTVQIEAPAHIELVSDMKMLIHSGTILADVPEQAIGFSIDTPSAKIIDHGTKFLVSHDATNPDATSYVEVLEGEIEVQGKTMTQSTRYKTGQRVFADSKKLTDISSDEEIPRSANTTTTNPNTITLLPSAEQFIIRGGNRKTHNNPQLIMLKNSTCDYARKAYLKFDLKGLDLQSIKKVSFNINMLDSKVGFASYVKDATFDVYGVSSEVLDNWKTESLNWKNAPATVADAGKMNPQATILLGSFSMPQGIYSGAYEVTSAELLNFIKADTNQQITIAIVRRTAETERFGLAHAFASSKNEKVLPPRLIIEQ
ncbi:MAG: DNRLRE domain-containing protein [Lentisphaeraceae bacterium]|nr:DNRLRE domain-containing protein [Lentisphaeraceae bacterium]